MAISVHSELTGGADLFESNSWKWLIIPEKSERSDGATVKAD